MTVMAGGAAAGSPMRGHLAGSGSPSERFAVARELPGGSNVCSEQKTAEAEAEDTRARMQLLARSMVLARAAVPMAKTAGMAAQDGARSAGTWVAPRINGARAWTAPRIEQSGLAIRDTIAPKICETLTATARRVDVTVPRVVEVTARRRRWLKVGAGTAILAAVGAAAAVVLLRRRNDGTCGAPEEAVEAGTGLPSAQDGQLRAGADGSGAEENVSSHSPPT